MPTTSQTRSLEKVIEYILDNESGDFSEYLSQATYDKPNLEAKIDELFNYETEEQMLSLLENLHDLKEIAARHVYYHALVAKRALGLNRHYYEKES